MNFKIGQDVVCVSKDISHDTIIGKTYPVLAINYCPGCNRQMINVGSPSHHSTYVRCQCRHLWDAHSHTRWFASSRFRPLEFISAHNELIEKFPMPEEVLDIPIKEPVI